MKKIIKGQIYDTSTAQLIAAVQLREIYQALYLKRSNEFFVYSVKDGRETISPLNYREADEWARIYLPDAAYQKFFGEIPEDSKKINVSIRLRGDTYQKLQRLSAACAMPASECIEQMLNGSYDALRGKKDEETNLYSGD